MNDELQRRGDAHGEVIDEVRGELRRLKGELAGRLGAVERRGNNRPSHRGGDGEGAREKEEEEEEEEEEEREKRSSSGYPRELRVVGHCGVSGASGG